MCSVHYPYVPFFTWWTLWTPTGKYVGISLSVCLSVWIGLKILFRRKGLGAAYNATMPLATMPSVWISLFGVLLFNCLFNFLKTLWKCNAWICLNFIITLIMALLKEYSFFLVPFNDHCSFCRLCDIAWRWYIYGTSEDNPDDQHRT